jgi:DHA1 family inner membrane transport protein
MQTTSWTNVAIFLAGGTIAAIHIGKVPTALAIIQLEFEMNLILAGLFFSIFSLIGVFLGVSAGSIFTKVASSKIIFSAFAILAICDVAGARTDDLFVLFLSRIFEGLCFVAIAVTFPTYIAFVTNARDRPLALSIWSLFIPIGFAISLTTSSALLSDGNWRDMWTFCAILSCLYLVIAYIFIPKNTHKTLSNKNPLNIIRSVISDLNLLKLSMIFTFYAFQWITIIAWFPSFLVENFNLNLQNAAIFTSLAVIVNIPGNLLGGRLNQLNYKPKRILMFATLAMFVSTCGIFFSTFGPIFAVFSALSFSFFAGLVPSTLFANVPVFSPSREHLGAANGLLFQGSALGQLIGSPVVASFIFFGGGNWTYAGAPLLICASAQLYLSNKLASRHEKPAPNN